MSDLCVVLCTCPDKSSARDIACKIVEKEQAACVNIISGMVSVYSWQGRVQQSSECQLVIKTTKAAVGKLQDVVLALHPYDVPEWVVLDITDSSTDYGNWIRSTVK
ncbi:MAG: divalent-cation tolerance protein CutA [Aestuariibacter sp.]